MQIISLKSLYSYDNNANKILKMLYNVLQELNISIIEKNIFEFAQFFDAERSVSIQDILDDIQNSTGIVICVSSQTFGVCAAYANFIEHISSGIYQNTFKEKNCLIIVIGEFGLISAQKFVSKSLNFLEAFDSIKININDNNLQKILNYDSHKEIFEKQIEDFYRIIKQNRKYFLPETQKNINIILENNMNFKKNKIKITPQDLLKKYNIQNLDQKKENDITEIVDYITTTSGVSNNNTNNINNDFHNVSYIQKNYNNHKDFINLFVKSLFSNLDESHNINTNCIVQFSIQNANDFYICVKNKKYIFTEGLSEKSDICITSAIDTLKEVFFGNISFQKAFMLGNIKIKGNFVLLSQLDKILYIYQQNSKKDKDFVY